MKQFMPGLDLCEYYYINVIQPLLDKQFPEISYCAGRLDYGSDVLGFDTPMSMDHGWGPKLTIYLPENQYETYHEPLDNYFAHHLPFDVLGFPTHFNSPLSDGGIMTKNESYPIQHMVTITTLEKWFEDYLGVNIHKPLSPEVWLTIPQQRLATLNAGRIFYDGLESLEALKRLFYWYPHDIWLYLLANQWRRIDQDEPFIGRTGIVDDELGSSLIGARLVNDLMKLGFLMAQTYSPYRKWFGSAFQQLKIAPSITPILRKILISDDWQTREKYLSQAYNYFGDQHNALKMTPFIQPEISNFHDRPFQVPHSARFAEVLLDQINDPSIKNLPPFLGSIDQICDNTDLLEDIDLCKQMRNLYG